jgi:hypothetical protein
MVFRILASILLLFSILFLPLWVSAILALAGIIYFAVFWEAAILFLLSDLLYGAREARFSGAVFISFAATVIILIIVEIVKKKTRLR